VPTLDQCIGYIEALEAKESMGDILRASRQLLIDVGIPAEVVGSLPVREANEAAGRFFSDAIAGGA
jgi:hypothetical protein